MTACCVCCSRDCLSPPSSPTVGNLRYSPLDLLICGWITGSVLILILLSPTQITPPTPLSRLPSYYIMGSSQNSDSRVRLYTELASPVIYAGQYLEGTAHLLVLEDTSYSSLFISLNGTEEVYWYQRSEKIVTTFRNSRKTYSEEFVLRRFEGGLKRGHYSFPFTMLLPSTLPATAQISPRNSISFVLGIYLQAETEKGKIQACNVPLNVREPLRLLSCLS